ncbi:DUF3006 domain-containing protein [Rossellomorea vietnamensis]|uniref:DUF3006 domain-containing protein n=1 Tax=Rossellomorea vietnamensis TaxID=218284 RepID=UPI003CFBA2FA
MRNKYTVDRFEGSLAVLLLRKDESIQIDIPKKELPDKIKVGDILELEQSEDGSIKNAIILKDETLDAKRKAEDLMQKLLNKNKPL